MGKQRGAPAWEGCWIPAGAKAASGGDGERAAACARHRGRDAPLGLAAACLGTERSRGWERGKSEPLGTPGWSQRSGAGTFGSPNCPGGAQSSGGMQHPSEARVHGANQNSAPKIPTSPPHPHVPASPALCPSHPIVSRARSQPSQPRATLLWVFPRRGRPDAAQAARGSAGPASTWLGEGVAGAFWHPPPHERAPLTALSSLQTSQFHCS